MLWALLSVVAMGSVGQPQGDNEWHTAYTPLFSSTYWACQHETGMGDYIYTKCASDEYRRRDRELNIAYNLKLAERKSEAMKQLRKAQRAWIATRDATCARIRLDEQGTIANHLVPQCLADQTIRRTIWLEKLR